MKKINSILKRVVMLYQLNRKISTMATDERNFRSTYYEKVGFRSVEEKKSLEILLKDKPLDKVKLKQFCLRFTVPGTYRNLLWKLLLGIVPVHIDSHQFVMMQRQQEYNDLIHALQIMRLIDSNTPKPQVFLTMWFLQTGKLKFDTNVQTCHGFVTIAQALFQIFEDDTDVYWMTKGFYSIVEQFRQDIPRLIDRTLTLLEKEDSKLYKHLDDIKVLNALPIATWFDCCFAGIINETALARIWDKLCGGSYKILVFVIIVTLTTMRHTLLKCNDIDSVIQCIDMISEETADVIANKAIELWQQHGSSLTIQDNPHPTKK